LPPAVRRIAHPRGGERLWHIKVFAAGESAASKKEDRREIEHT